MTLQSFMVQESMEDISSRFVKSLTKQSFSISGEQGSGCSYILTSVWNMFSSYYPTALIEFLMKSKQTTVITGSKGSGKTTLMMSLIELIDPMFNLRTQEENIGYLRKLFPIRNITTLRDTTNRYESKEPNVMYTSDNDVSVFNEMEKQDSILAKQYLNSRFSIFTHYGKDFSDVVTCLKNSFVQEGKCSNEKHAEQLVVNLIDFNIHVVRNKDGSRYIERITECVPVNLPNGEQLYEARNIVELKEGTYVTVHPISQERQEMIECSLSEEDKVAFKAFNKLHWVDET